jgi:eukaryotic-like serine/threonine-protein kinase
VSAFRPPAALSRVVRLTYLLPDGQRLSLRARGAVALSPEGTAVVYAANRQLYVRRLNESRAWPLPGTNLDASTPFFSPDGRWLGFWSARDSTLKKIPIDGGTALTLGPLSNPRGASWFGDLIVVAEREKGLVAIPAGGGTPQHWVQARGDEVILSPQMLPGGDAVLFTAARAVGNLIEKNNVVV